MRVSHEREYRFQIAFDFSGVRAVCPLNDTQFFKPIDTPCNQNTQLCDRGV